MSDFFGLLSQRALQPTAIHPRLPSRFESAGTVPVSPGQDVSTDVPPRADQPAPAAAAVVPAALIPPPLTVSARAPMPLAEPVMPITPVPPSPGSAPVRQPAPQLIEPLLPPQSVRPTALDAAANPVPAAVPPQPDVLASVQVSRESPTATLRIEHERMERHELSREVIEQRVERLVAEPGPALPSLPATLVPTPAQPVRDVPSAPVPRVEISIGRIEVLPMDAAVAPRHSEPAKPAPAQSLDAYLQARSAAEPGRGGRR